MRVNIIIFSFVVFLVKGYIAKVDDKKSFSKLFDANLVNNYEKLFKVIKCQYCLTQKKGEQNAKCKQIMKECKHLLKNGEYITMLKNLMNDLKVGNNEHVYGPNTTELKKIINFLELHKQQIKKIKNMIDTIKNNKAALLINGGNNAMVHKLNKGMKSLKNSVEYIQKSQDVINEQLSQNDGDLNHVLPDMFQLKGISSKDVNELIQLGNITYNDEEHKHELGSLGVDEIVKTSMKDLFKDGQGLMDVVKNTLIQEGPGIGGDLVNLIEKGKEIGEKIVDIEGMITNKNGTAKMDKATIQKLDHFKTELSSYEFLITSLKGVVLTKLKDILLRLLYKAYINYKTKQAKEAGEAIPTEVPEEQYLDELKKGGLELGIKILFNKLRYLLILIKKKLFPHKFGPKHSNKKQDGKNTDTKQVTAESANLHAPMLRGFVSAEDMSLMNSIDNMIEEIDFYEKEIYKNPHTGEVIHGGHKGTAAGGASGVQGMDDFIIDDMGDDTTDEDDMTEQVAEEVVDQVTEEVADQIAHDTLENIAHDMAHMEAVVHHITNAVQDATHTVNTPQNFLHECPQVATEQHQAEVTPEPITEVTPEHQAEVTPEPPTEITPEHQAEVTPEPPTEITPEHETEVTPEPPTEITPEHQAEVTPEPPTEVTPEP
ncbi:hypothetical protein AK88_02332 [Plasmodium fragile]|uniref:Merozoite surface protein-9 n=1 Tax=Plasmodium fragile TaxID=5857 RepID=A0A0D9QMN3_PLAFR|nr:uncharacterized protein AK88_02332 [Plasmodium fragile]KJP88057.1 hypothetical protein AK88_02332 [Plasmodium fragile]